MPEKDQMELACDFSKKMNTDDILIVGNVELSQNIGFTLEKLGFKKYEKIKEIFIKEKNLLPNEFTKIRKFLIEYAENIAQYI